jgi:hypothetical protein
MSLLDTASLIVTPNGYKEGKLYSVIPSDGSGDLSVTRATTATRVNSAGLVELVPYNLFSYSQDLTNAAYTSGGTGSVVVTANYATAPDGTTTADRVQITRGATYQELFQRITGYSGQQVTMSFYAKSLSGTPTLITAFNDGYYNEVTFTTEWVRYEYTFTAGTNVTGSGFNLLTFVSFPSTSASADLLVWGVQLVQGSTAKDYQKTETRLNIPRLDYSNGTCPSLLVEPQRTNIALQSSSFDSSTWSKNELTVGTNAFVSPSGIQDADKIIPNTVNTFHTVQQVLSVSSGATYSFSIYAKASGYNYVVFNTGGSTAGNSGPIVNLSNGTIAGFFGSTDYNAQVEDVGNGWYRISFAFTTNSTSASVDINIFPTATVASYAGNGTSGCLFWGYQFEAGSYATSYIPTTSASVTRNADVISKTGISSLIGQTEGTLYAEINFPELQSTGASSYVYITGGSFNNSVIIGREPASPIPSKYFFYINANGTIILANSSNNIQSGFAKMAIAYKSGDWAAYLNGTLVASGTSTFSFGSTLSNFAIGTNDGGQSLVGTSSMTKAVALWKTRLDNATLATLTTL